MSKRISSGRTFHYRNGKREELTYPEPTRLSKFGEWAKAHPNGLEGVIVNERAVMR